MLSYTVTIILCIISKVFILDNNNTNDNEVNSDFHKVKGIQQVYGNFYQYRPTVLILTKTEREN